jgi:DNA-binding GntR family transcriptional regulator
VNPKENKAQRAYREIRRMIFDGEFTRERRWSQRGISRQLGMSMIPVSEAVRRLEQQGLLQTKSRSGIRLLRITPQRQKDMFCFREAIEVQAVRMIIQRKKTDMKFLRRLAEKLSKQLREEKFHEAANTDCEFHSQLVKLAGNSLMSEKYDELVLCLLSNACWSDPTSMVQREAFYPVNHTSLVEALESGSLERAEKAIRDHLDTSTANIKNIPSDRTAKRK